MKISILIDKHETMFILPLSEANDEFLLSKLPGASDYRFHTMNVKVKRIMFSDSIELLKEQDRVFEILFPVK